jgi:hypothetical protein
MHRFICGCDTKFDGSAFSEIVAEQGEPFPIPTFDSIRYDAEGYLACKIHGCRYAGWRSIQTATINGLRLDYAAMWERLQIGKPTSDFQPSQTFDRRDNRDPEDVGHKLLACAASMRHEAVGLKIPLSTVANRYAA